MEIIGRVLWWSKKDENGVILDAHGNEYYFDRSVLNIGPKQKVSSGQIVIFKKNIQINEILCAKDVEIPLANKRSKYQKRYEQESSQPSLFAFME